MKRWIMVLWVMSVLLAPGVAQAAPVADPGWDGWGTWSGASASASASAAASANWGWATSSASANASATANNFFVPQPHPVNTCVYWVREGDTLSSIAWAFGTTVHRLARFNWITHPNRIFVGMRLRIPDCN